MLPISVKRRGNCFGEESLLPHEHFESRISVRTVTSTQVAVLTREAFFTLFERYPQVVADVCGLIVSRRSKQDALYHKLNINFCKKDKVKEFLGTSVSLYAENKVHANNIIGPDTLVCKMWRTLQRSFRIAFLPNPSKKTMLLLAVVDYLCDMLLLADIYLKWNRLEYIQYGEKIVDIAAIRK
uniref:Cyclic nucleotide-binding domain-containing protein n=1 Tax=Globisporangium ultimum (strain ATCC 200006 / CBS 805.95 / DAOM BR144) TaxID=431595 RepID=K3WDY8_GLOUD